ncbi:low affinity potassium transporter [Penicillium hetheringtonii]|uniref:Low affinity potassium transporter n=1 Tax=Penicillium hetheringtonii TaxID=911720 RepID=A0AAD6DAM7_9EURO|nr:low affinity potassium transporter [Penicillium hetheringtonii]
MDCADRQDEPPKDNSPKNDDIQNTRLNSTQKLFPTPIYCPPQTERLQQKQQVDEERTIAFLESQRTENDTLRIPSPREYERGGQPHVLDETEEKPSPLRRTSTLQSGSDMIGENSCVAARESSSFNRPQKRCRLYTDPTLPNLITNNVNHKTEGLPKPLNVQAMQQNRGTSKRLNPFVRDSEVDRTPYLSWTPTIGRNSTFIDLSEAQRDELGGIEYRALKTLAVALVFYFVGFHLIGVICLVPWVLRAQPYGSYVDSAGLSRGWWGVFTAGSATNDLGFTLTPDSMSSFSGAIFPLLLMSFLIVIGNTGFPCMLRFIIWLLSLLVPRGGAVWEELRFLLDHPRRCFTLLFPRGATWWLFAVLLVLNGVDVFFFFILDLNDTTVTRIPAGIRFVDGLFQAVCTRTAGFSVLSLSDLHPAIQVSYMFMMYISVFPVAISIRRTNVYEERSLGIYSPTDDQDDANATERGYTATHLRKQLGFDLWFVFLGLFLIVAVEGKSLADPARYSFNIFSVLFEIVSAYGTVGLSMGYPGISASFSAELKTLSKLIIIAMQIRGRHRGLPYDLDRAILLPTSPSKKGNFRMRRGG